MKRKLHKRYGRAARGKVHSITVVGRRWFNRGPGNTYFSADIYVNGEHVHRIPFSYGYGDHYADEAGKWLIKNGYVQAEEYKHGGYPAMWRLAEEQGFKFIATATDVSRKKDL